MSREDPQMKLRLPADVRDRIKLAAEQNNRSLNAEILARLEDSFDGNQQLWDSVNRIADMMEGMGKQMEKLTRTVNSLGSRPYDDPDQERD